MALAPAAQDLRRDQSARRVREEERKWSILDWEGADNCGYCGGGNVGLDEYCGDGTGACEVEGGLSGVDEVVGEVGGEAEL